MTKENITIAEIIKARKQKYINQTKMLEIDLKEKKGELLNVCDVDRDLSVFFAIITTELKSIENEIYSISLQNNKTKEEIEKEISNFVHGSIAAINLALKCDQSILKPIKKDYQHTRKIISSSFSCKERKQTKETSIYDLLGLSLKANKLDVDGYKKNLKKIKELKIKKKINIKDIARNILEHLEISRKLILDKNKCAICKKEIKEKNKKTCSEKCKKIRINQIKQKHEWHVKEYQRYQEKQKALKKEYKKLIKKISKIKYEEHVKQYKNFKKTSKIKHKSHVEAWKAHLKNPGAAARYWKKVNKPWRNPYLSGKCKYAIRYRLDIAFRLSEINRNTWRKQLLAERDDGTINFWMLIRERNTCPYCLTVITKENAVADHMDPIKHGGANSQKNLTICCRPCNTKKAGRPFVEWLDMLPEKNSRVALDWYMVKHGHPPEQTSFCFEFKYQKK